MGKHSYQSLTLKGRDNGSYDGARNNSGNSGDISIGISYINRYGFCFAVVVIVVIIALVVGVVVKDGE